MLKKRNTLRIIASIIAISTAFTACKKDTVEPVVKPINKDDNSKEYKYLRVLVSDEVTSTITQVDPFEVKVSAFTGKYPSASLYGTAAGRYAAVVYSTKI